MAIVNLDQVEILIDVRKCLLVLKQGGEEIKRFPVAVGKKKTPTPVGEYRIMQKARWGGAFGTRWMGLDVPWGTYGIHGTNRPDSIGTAASHGCIRMLNRHVEELYDRVEIGTKVVIDGPIHQQTLVRDSAGRLVQLVQIKLRDAGIFTGDLDGKFGSDLEEAVSLWQLAKNIPVTGQIREQELDLLGIILG